MSADPKRIIVTESCCHACSGPTILVHHQTFPEMRVGGMSAKMAAGHLVNLLAAAHDSALDPSRREAVLRVLSDVQAFLDREGAAHIARDI